MTYSTPQPVGDRLKHGPLSGQNGARRKMAFILKGVGKIDGDGWKDVTTRGEEVFVYGSPLPKPYAPTQYERVGAVGWTASDRQYDFVPASLREIVRLIPTVLNDIPERRRYAFRRQDLAR